MSNTDHEYESNCLGAYLKIPQEAIDAICTSGANDAAVDDWVDQLDWSNTTDAAIVTDLKECGADWDYDDEQVNRERFLWNAAWYCFDTSEVDA